MTLLLFAMPGSRHGSGGAPSSQYLTPTSDNRGIPQWKLQQQQQQRPGMRSPQNNGFGHPQVRPPTVDEALQYSSLSSIVPHNPGKNPTKPCQPSPSLSPIAHGSFVDIISLPTIGHSGFVSITSALSDHNMSRQSLAYLNNETLSNNGSSILLDEAVSKIRNYLVPEELTEL